jgi:hypothetical protein
LLLVLLAGAAHVQAQQNAYENDLKYARKKYHFGIHLGVGLADYRIRHSEAFALSDSVLSIKSNMTLGYEIGALASYHINKNLELRILPTFLFNDKNLNIKYKDETSEDIKLPTILYEMPVEIKFKSDPIKDFKIYVVAGFKYSYDIGSNLSGRLDTDLPQQKANDFSINYGVGFEFHFPLFILSPEFKVSNSLLNIYRPTHDFIQSNMIQRIYNRTFLFSLTFEG